MLRILVVAALLVAVGAKRAAADVFPARAVKTNVTFLGSDAVWAEQGAGGVVRVRRGVAGTGVRDIAVVRPSEPGRRVNVEARIAGSAERVAIAVTEVGPSSRVGTQAEDVFLHRVLTWDAAGAGEEVARCVPEGRAVPAYSRPEVAVGGQAVAYRLPECAREGLDRVTVSEPGLSRRQLETTARLVDAAGTFLLLDDGRELTVRDSRDGGIVRRAPRRLLSAVQDNGAVALGDASGPLTLSPPDGPSQELGRVAGLDGLDVASGRVLYTEGARATLRLASPGVETRTLSRYVFGAGALSSERAAWFAPSCAGTVVRVAGLRDREPRRARCPLVVARRAAVSRGTARVTIRCSGYVGDQSCGGSARATAQGRAVGRGRVAPTDEGALVRLRLTAPARSTLRRRGRLRVRLAVRTRDVAGRVEERSANVTLGR